MAILLEKDAIVLFEGARITETGKEGIVETTADVVMRRQDSKKTFWLYNGKKLDISSFEYRSATRETLVLEDKNTETTYVIEPVKSRVFGFGYIEGKILEEMGNIMKKASVETIGTDLENVPSYIREASKASA